MITSLRPVAVTCCACALAALAVAGTQTQTSPPNGGASRLIGPVLRPHGDMVVQISPDRPRRRFTGPQPTPDEALDAISGYAAYFGTYTVDERASCSYLKSARTCGRSGSRGSA